VYDNRVVLILYKRHLKGCPHKADRFYRRCRSCSVWIEGVHDSVYRCHSLKTSSWEKAEEKKRELERGEEKAPAVTVVEAGKTFLEHLTKKQVSSATIRKFEILLSKLESFTHHSPLLVIDTPIVERFRNTWTWSPLTTAKYIERLRGSLTTPTRATLVPLCRRLLMETLRERSPTLDHTGTSVEWLCPLCAAPMKVIEKLTAQQIRLRFAEWNSFVDTS
jgi:hypothetical protein